MLWVRLFVRLDLARHLDTYHDWGTPTTELYDEEAARALVLDNVRFREEQQAEEGGQ